MPANTLNGTALASVAVGSLFIWAAVTGKSVLATVQTIVSGKSPALLTNVNPVSGVDSGLTAAQVASPSTTFAAPVNQQQFIKEVLAGIGAPDTPSNESSMAAWIAREGGGGQNNPLNTTFPLGAATNFNSVGVKNYGTPQDGVAATVDTLKNGSYQDVVLMLRSGQGLCGRSFSGLSTWSGGGYSKVC